MRLCAAVALAAACGSAASAAHAAARHEINLPAGRLGDALAALGRQAGISVGVSDPALAAERVPAIGGKLSVEQALGRLLKGRAAGVVTIDAATYRIVRRQPARLSLRRPPPPPPDRPAPAPALLPDSPVEQAEIVVTASRWDVPLRAYPGSVTIVGGREPVFAQALRGTEALISRLPSLSSTHLGPGRNKLFVRGISDSSFNGPTQATVGQYLDETRLNYNAPDPDLRLYDIDRVELLAGPQGTLYGAGSLGGIIRIVPNAPRLDTFEADGSLGVSATQHGDPGTDAAAVVNLPLVDGGAAVRLSAYGISEGGYIDDRQRGLDDVNRVRVAGGRLALRGAPDAYWTLDLGATAQRIRGEDAQYAERGEGKLTRRSPLRQDFGNDYLLGTIVAAREWDDYRLVASTGIVRQKLEERYDTTRFTNLIAAYDLTTKVSLFSAEARISRRGALGSGWLVGGSFVSNRSAQSRDVSVKAGTFRRNRVENDIDEGALYGEGSVGLLSGVTATLGGRLATARLSSSGFAFRPGFPLPPSPKRASRSDTRFLPAAALTMQAGRDLLVYARYQESFRPGGLAMAGDEFTRFRPDRLSSIEAGARYGVPGHGKVDASAAIAYTRWSDIQADTIDIFNEPTTANVGNARIYTLDLTLGWRPLPGFAVEAGAVFNDAQLSGLRPGLSSLRSPPLPGTARFNGRLAAQYGFAASGRVDLSVSGSARYTGRSNLGAGDFLRRRQGDWLDVSLLLGAQVGRHQFTLGVTNLIDTAANRFALGSPLLLNERDFTTPVRPRTVRLGWELAF
jgi:outer membrane receptor protein involved in Fe transport